MENLTVAIWMVTYNHEDYIEQAIESVMMQKTTFKYKLFIGEDCSTDATGTICKKLKDKYPDKIELILNDKNLGDSLNGLNIYDLCLESNDKYIAMLEGDDYWTDPLKLRKQVDYLESNPDTNICFHRANLLKNDALSLHPIPTAFEMLSFKFIELLKHYNFITTASVVFRSPELFKLPEWFENITFGDLGLYKIVSQNKDLHCINEVMSVYRIHDNGLFSGLNNMQSHRNYLNFYFSIYEHLDIQEQEIVTIKIKDTIKLMAKLKFPKSRLLQDIYSIYIHFKSSNI